MEAKIEIKCLRVKLLVESGVVMVAWSCKPHSAENTLHTHILDMIICEV